MQAVFLWNDAYWQTQFISFLLIAVLAIGGLAVLLAVLRRLDAATRSNTAAPPASLLARLSWFERLLLLAVVLSVLVSLRP